MNYLLYVYNLNSILESNDNSKNIIMKMNKISELNNKRIPPVYNIIKL